MTSLSEQEIMALLESMDPEEILIAKKDQLDDGGRQFLEDLKQDIQAGHEMFETFGRKFREADDKTGASHPAEEEKARSANWLGLSFKLPYWAALAAVVVLGFIALLPAVFDSGELTRTRGRSTDLAAIQLINQELAAVLRKRGESLLEAGNQQGKRDYYHEARADLMQAYQLDPDNIELLALLARVHEKLGRNKQANRFLEEWSAAKSRRDQP